MSLFWQRESDVHLNTNVLEVDSETMWSGLERGGVPPWEVGWIYWSHGCPVLVL